MTPLPPSISHLLRAHPHQLLLDDLMIAQQSGLTRQLGPITKYHYNPVITPTEPHEQMGLLMFGTLTFDQGRYRCWYHTAGAGTHFCYAESNDGLSWTKPHLGLTDFRNRRANNILFSAPQGMALANVSVAQSLAEHDPNRRYRAALFMYRKDNHRGPARGHYLIYSPDGIHWSKPSPLPQAACNECGGLLWDPSRTDFVDLNKTGHALQMLNREDMRVGHTRCTAVAASDDGTAWTPYRVVLTPNLYLDQPFDEFYHLHGFRSAGSYVGYLRVYHNTPDSGPPPRQCIDVQLATSRDGQNWQRVCPGSTFIPIGAPGAWDFGRIALGNAPPVPVQDQMRIYYCGQPTDHRGGDGRGGQGENGLNQGYTGKIGFATIRPDGFACLTAGPQTGELITHPITPGSHLTLNIDAPHGQCRVEIQSPHGRPLDGFSLAQSNPIQGDHLAAPATWQPPASIPTITHPRVRLRITLHHAKLYSWTFHTKPPQPNN